MKSFADMHDTYLTPSEGQEECPKCDGIGCTDCNFSGVNTGPDEDDKDLEEEDEESTQDD